MSRFTFRSQAGDVAWQRQLRDRWNHEGAPPGADLSLKRAKIERVSRSIAESIILRYEWLGTLGTASVFYGLMFGRYCGGVCCVAVNGTGTGGPKVSDKFGIHRRDMLILARGACTHWAPCGANSKLVAWTCKMARRERLGRVIMAFTDSDAGEVGTIYQACGWTYLGKYPAGGVEHVSPKGRVLPPRTVANHAKKNGVRYCDYCRWLERNGWRKQQVNRKGRYVQVLDTADVSLVTLVASMAVPYPKRAGSIASDAAANHAVEGGSTPTPALHTPGTS